MSLLIRFRIAVVDWYVRVSEARRAPLPWDDLEGMGRRLASPRPHAASPVPPTRVLTKAPVVRPRALPA